MTRSPPAGARNRHLGAWALIAALVAIIAAAFGYVGGWLAPGRLTPNRIINQFQRNAGVFPGYRRNHAKGVCFSGYFQSSGYASPYSVAQVFVPGQRTPVVGRFAIPGSDPYAPDNSVAIRSMALRFALANGQQWRTGMNSMPVFPVSTPQAFFEMLQAKQPDPATGKPDPKKVAAFFASHPETTAFRAWAASARPSDSFATDNYWSLNAFVFVDVHGGRYHVRWRMEPENVGDAGTTASTRPDFLAADLRQRLTQGPLRWKLIVTLANPGDPTDDATKPWPASRRAIDAGTLVVERTEPQRTGPCRDINYDPLVLPHGIEPSDDPLLPARSAAYADSYLRRTSEEARWPGTRRSHATTPPENK